MAKRKEGGIGLIAAMPWPVGLVLGIVVFFVIRDGIGWALSSNANPVLSAMGQQSAKGVYAPLGWFGLFACWLGALLSFINQRHRKRLLDTQTGLDSIRAMSWKQFELLVGEAFRRQGYTVQETGLGGADGGIDLVLRKDGRATLVQCKQWRTQRVTVNVVREMFGLLGHHRADAVIIVCAGHYTSDAQQFAQAKPIELISGDKLLEMVRSVQTVTVPQPVPVALGTAPPESAPACPKCGMSMIRRENRRTREAFWGCPTFPSCRGIKVIS